MVSYNERVRIARLEAINFINRTDEYIHNGEHRGRHHASMIRASMDLSNELSDLRKGRYYTGD